MNGFEGALAIDTELQQYRPPPKITLGMSICASMYLLQQQHEREFGIGNYLSVLSSECRAREMARSDTHTTTEMSTIPQLSVAEKRKRKGAREEAFFRVHNCSSDLVKLNLKLNSKAQERAQTAHASGLATTRAFAEPTDKQERQKRGPTLEQCQPKGMASAVGFQSGT